MTSFLPPLSKKETENPCRKNETTSHLKTLTIYRGLTKQEKNALSKAQLIRDAQPKLTKLEIARFQDTFKHSLCLDMLREGFHRSFCEIHTLMGYHKDQRLKAGPDSALWYKPILENEKEKLLKLKEHLTVAETYVMDGNFENAYDELHDLALHFLSSGDIWLCEYFSTRCLQMSRKIKSDIRYRKEADSNREIGQIFLSRGDLEMAKQFLEAYYNNCFGRDWTETDSNVTLRASSCEMLRLLYTTMADQEDSIEAAVLHLVKAYEMAKEGGEELHQASAGYRLGLAYQRLSDHESAVNYFKSSLQISEHRQDFTMIGILCEALAESLESENKVDEALQYLLRFETVTRDGESTENYGRACRALGAMYNTLGNYAAAVEFFQKAFNTDSNDMSAVSLGIASAHSQFTRMTSLFQERVQRQSMQQLLDWKDTRKSF